MEWEKILANEAIVKGFISKICKQLCFKKKQQLNQKMGKRSKYTFLKGRPACCILSHSVVSNSLQPREL